MGAYPGASPRDSFESPHHHVVVDAAQVPGLTDGAKLQTRAEPGPPAGSPDDGGVRRYPSWDDVADDIGDHGRDGFDVTTRRQSLDPDPSLAYAAETASPPRRFPENSARRTAGAFPGHEAFPGADLGADLLLRPPRSRKSFAAGGVDPIDMRFDARAVREAALEEAKRAQFRAALDEQVAFKKRAEAERKRRESLEASGVDPDREPAAHRSGDARVDRANSHSHHSHLASPPRETMRGVPRRGVNPGNGDYSSPAARAGGGPSSFFLGGGDPYRGGGAADGAPARFADGGGAFVDARASNAAEARRRQLVADLDAQVRAKREQKRLRELREELEDAKIERRIQEVIEQERLEREMKERLLERPEDASAPGEYRVTNSPRASVADLASVADREVADAPRGRTEGAEEGSEPEPRRASPRRETYEGAEIVHAEDDDAPNAYDSSAPEPIEAPIEAAPIEAAAKSTANRALPADDDASALTPQRQLQRSPELGARRPARVDKSGSPRDDVSVAAARALEYADAPSLIPPRDVYEASTFPASSPASNSKKAGARAATPLDAKIEKLQMELERRDVDLESARDEARRLERERDLAERERDLEHQLHKIRTEMAAGGALGTAATRAAAAGFFVENAPSSDARGRSFVGTDVASFVVRSGFVRADAPIGVSESQAMHGGDFNALVPEGYTVRPDEARGGDKKASAAPRVAGLQRRAARAAAAERGGGKGASGRRAASKENDPGKENPRRPVWGANRAPNDRATRGRAARGNRWS